jgi:flagellar biosynthesis regulator FlbT
MEKKITQMGSKLRQIYYRFVEKIIDPELRERAELHLARGDLEGALDVIEEVFGRIGVEWIELMQEHLKEEASAISKLIGVTLLVNVTHPRVVDLLRRNEMAIVQRMVTSQKQATRGAHIEAIARGEDSREAFWSSIGLSSSLHRRLRRYRESLDMQNEMAAENRTNQLSRKEVNRLMGAVRSTLVEARAEQISRTAAVRFASEALDTILEQAVEQGKVDPGRVVRQWNRIADDRVRDAHDYMQGQKAAMGEAFTDGNGNSLRYPGDPQAPLETTINCRCWLTAAFK